MFLQPHEVSSQTDQSTMSSEKGISISWMLLDNQSTINVFSNADLLTDIQKRVISVSPLDAMLER